MISQCVLCQPRSSHSASGGKEHGCAKHTRLAADCAPEPRFKWLRLRPHNLVRCFLPVPPLTAFLLPASAPPNPRPPSYPNARTCRSSEQYEKDRTTTCSTMWSDNASAKRKLSLASTGEAIADTAQSPKIVDRSDFAIHSRRPSKHLCTMDLRTAVISRRL